MNNSLTNRVLTIVLSVVLLGLVGAIVSMSMMPHRSQGFTEFYFLGPEGVELGYPPDLRSGETARVTVVVVNHEYDTVDYRIEVLINGTVARTIDGITLPNDGKWQRQVTFNLTERGDDQRLEFVLYRIGESTPYRGPLVLRVNVS